MKHGKHYRQSDVDTLDVIEAWGLNFSLGNVLKYIQRHVQTKNPDDLEKALWYLVYTMKSKDEADEVVETLVNKSGVLK